MTTVTCAPGLRGLPTEHLAQGQAHRCAQGTHSDTFEMCHHLAGGLGSRLFFLAVPCSPERTAAPFPTASMSQPLGYKEWTLRPGPCCQWFPRNYALLLPGHATSGLTSPCPPHTYTHTTPITYIYSPHPSHTHIHTHHTHHTHITHTLITYTLTHTLPSSASALGPPVARMTRQTEACLGKSSGG